MNEPGLGSWGIREWGRVRGLRGMRECVCVGGTWRRTLGNVPGKSSRLERLASLR